MDSLPLACFYGGSFEFRPCDSRVAVLFAVGGTIQGSQYTIDDSDFCQERIADHHCGRKPAYLFGEVQKQGSDLKFDHRDQARNNGRFLFRSQVLDNMYWTLASGVTFWTLFEFLYFWASGQWVCSDNNFRTESGLVYALACIDPALVLIPFLLGSTAPYWPPLYRIAHSVHHRNINVGPWSGISMHPVEHMIYFTSILIHFAVASHPIHVFFHLFVQALGPCLSHSGFDGLLVKDRKRVELGDFFHQLHHRYFECNYGTSDMPWDVWFDSFHNGSPESTDRVRSKKKKMHNTSRAAAD